MGLAWGELPHVRMWHDDGFDIIIDGTFGPDLDDHLANGAPRIAVLAPNISWTEFDKNEGFPVVVRDEAAQRMVLLAAINQALADGCDVIVAPELSVPELIADELGAALMGHEGVLLVAGSHHREEDGVRINEALTYLGGIAGPVLRQRKSEPFAESNGSREGISLGQRPTLTVLCGDRVRFATVICKDFLTPGTARVLGKLGVHLVAVPAMSSSVDEFANAAGVIHSLSQGLVVVANGPSDGWPRQQGPVPHAMCSQPIRGDLAKVASAVGRRGWRPLTLGRQWEAFRDVT